MSDEYEEMMLLKENLEIVDYAYRIIVLSVTKWNQDEMKNIWGWLCHQNYFTFLLEYPQFEDEAVELEKKFNIYYKREEIKTMRTRFFKLFQEYKYL